MQEKRVNTEDWVSQGMLLVRVTFEMTVNVDLFTGDEKMEIGEWD